MHLPVRIGYLSQFQSNSPIEKPKSSNYWSMYMHNMRQISLRCTFEVNYIYRVLFLSLRKDLSSSRLTDLSQTASSNSVRKVFHLSNLAKAFSGTHNGAKWTSLFEKIVLNNTNFTIKEGDLKKMILIQGSESIDRNART
jgi:hypothetical protein